MCHVKASPYISDSIKYNLYLNKILNNDIKLF